MKVVSTISAWGCLLLWIKKKLWGPFWYVGALKGMLDKGLQYLIVLLYRFEFNKKIFIKKLIQDNGRFTEWLPTSKWAPSKLSDSLMVRALTCHAADPGSNPAQCNDFYN